MSKKQSNLNWWLLVIGIIYFFFPFDLIPDALPLVGWIDDIIVAIILYKMRK